MLRKLLSIFQPPRDNRGTGASAEALAADWLRRERGFAIVARNWRNPRDRRDELDLVCRDRDVLVFVEVKARAAEALVPGFYAIDRRKRRVLLRTAKAYLARLHPKPVTFRCDVVEVQLPPRGPGAESPPQVRHFENVPLFAKHYRG